MPCVSNHGLRIEQVSSNAFRNSHAQVGVESNPSYSHTGVVFICGRQVDIVVVVMPMAIGMAPNLRINCSHCPGSGIEGFG